MYRICVCRLPCDQYPPHLCWPDERTLIVGWGDSVKVCRVKERPTRPSSLSSGMIDLPPHYLEIGQCCKRDKGFSLRHIDLKFHPTHSGTDIFVLYILTSDC